MLRTWITILAATSCLAACQTSQSDIRLVNSEAFDLSQAQVARVHEGIRRNLPDPQSARFGPVIARKTYSETGSFAYVVCGQVESTNGNGAVDRTPYIAALSNDLKQFRQGMLGGPNGASTSVARHCNEAGIRL